MFSPATLAAAHRLITTLMTLVRAISPVALAGGTRTFSELAAHALFERLSRLVAALIVLTTEGPRRRRQHHPKAATPARSPAAPATPDPLRTEDCKLRTEHGWLLKALPDTAPAIAVEIETLLSDPALAPLLDAEPGLRRTLNPLLRSLGLAPLPILAAAPPDAAPPAEPDPPPLHHAPPERLPPAGAIQLKSAYLT